jgi:hypothetical protein
MRRFLKVSLAVLGILLLCVPITFVTAFLLTPLWSWIEARYGIESLGHSGPAEWCFLATFVVLALVCLSTLALVFKTHRRKQGYLPRHE